MTLNEIAYLAFVIVEVIVLFIAATYAVFLVYSWLHGAPFVGTENDQFENIFSSITIVSGMTFLDIGCGDGRVVIDAIKKYKVNGIGIDINPLLICYARFRASWLKIYSAKFYIAKIDKFDFSKADIIYIYLFPKLVEKLIDKIRNEAHPGTYIISHAFKIEGLEEHFLKSLSGKKFKTHIYLIT